MQAELLKSIYICISVWMNCPTVILIYVTCRTTISMSLKKLLNSFKTLYEMLRPESRRKMKIPSVIVFCKVIEGL